MNDWPAVRSALEQQMSRSLRDARTRPVGGGDVSYSLRVDGGGHTFFLKYEPLANAARLEAEAAGLAEMAQATQMHIPDVLALGTTDASAFLALEYMDMHPPDSDSAPRLGEALAEMHGIVSPNFGWYRNNFIGLNPQYNQVNGVWLEFFRENRLRVMVDALAVDYPALANRGDRLLTSLDALIGDHRPEASLVHGDLWAGNVGCDERGMPTLFDPAVYYGDRETDLAMAELFGGFPPLFFESYWHAWPIPIGYRRVRRPLYQLYHLLNHVRQFGEAFVRGSHAVIDQLLAELRGD